MLKRGYITMTLVVALLLASAVFAQDTGTTDTTGRPGRAGFAGLFTQASAATYDASAERLLVAGFGGGRIVALTLTGEASTLFEDEALQGVRALHVDANANRLYVLQVAGAGGFSFGGAGDAGTFRFAPGQGAVGQGTNAEADDAQPAITIEGTPIARGQRAAGAAPFTGEQAGAFLSALGNAVQAITLRAYDLSDNTLTFETDLSEVAPEGPRFVTSMTQDADGNIYISDSAAGALYLVTPSGAPFYLAHPAFAGQGIGFTGLAFDAATNTLLAVHTLNGTLLRIPLADPTNVTVVTLPEALAAPADLFVMQNGDVLLLSASAGELLRLRSADAWQSAELVGRTMLETGVASLVQAGDALHALQFTPPTADGAVPAYRVTLAVEG